MTPQECHEAVTPDWADGDEMPCNADAIAMRLDEEGGMYPVCIDHTRVPMAPLVRPAAQSAPAAPRASVGTSGAANGAQGGAHGLSLGDTLRHIADSEAIVLGGYVVERLAERAEALERERDEAVSRYHLEVAARRRVEGELAEMTRTARSMSSSARRALIARMDAQ